MFFVELTYKKDLSEVDHFGKEHVDFLERKVSEGVLIFSGRKIPRTGGVLLFNLPTQQDVEAHIADDPFHREKIADYRLLEFTPVKFDPRFACFAQTQK